MGPIVILLLLTLFIGGLVHLFRRQEARRISKRASWKRQMAALGLKVQVHGEYHLSAQGSIKGVPVWAQLKHEQEGEDNVLRARLTLESKAIPRNLEVLADSMLRSAGRLVQGSDDLTVGDPEFDDQVELSALDAYICAALSHGARQRVLTLLRWRGRVQQGQVTCRLNMEQQDEGDRLSAVLLNAVALARLLSVPPEALHGRLAKNALEDPAPAVRLKNLRFLVAAQTQTPPALLASTARTLLGDVHPVRLLAAQQLGAAGHATLRGLATSADVKLEQRVAAASSLGQGATPDLDGLRALLDGKQPLELQLAALCAIPATGTPLTDGIVSCTRSEHEAVRAAAARALGVLAQPQTEPTLLTLLSDASADVKHASAEALGVLGSVAAVAPLLPLAEGLLRPQLRQAARGAIGRIQSRLGAVEAGRVSLAESHDLAGAVDLADTSAAVRAGELSLVEQEASAQTGEEGGSPPRAVVQR